MRHSYRSTNVYLTLSKRKEYDIEMTMTTPDLFRGVNKEMTVEGFQSFLALIF